MRCGVILKHFSARDGNEPTERQSVTDLLDEYRRLQVTLSAAKLN
jgi:hypothetical protein